jgi:hypothetical protein
MNRKVQLDYVTQLIPEEPSSAPSGERPYVYKADFVKQGADSYLSRIIDELKPKMGPADTYGRMKAGKLDCTMAFSGYRQSLWIGPEINPGRSEARRCSHGPEQREWPSVLAEIKARVESEVGEQFNSCLVNFYPTGNGGIAHHRDQDDESDWNHSIASVSLGAERLFNIYDVPDGTYVKTGKLIARRIHSARLAHGSLCVMQSGFQAKYEHEIPVEKNIKAARINLTFRWVAPFQQSNKTGEKNMRYESHDDAYKPPQKTIGGYNGYQVVSALQKCIRRGLEQDALFWATELWASSSQTGREYIWHRLRVIASEDIGLADNDACVQVSALYANFTRRPNEKIFLWHAVLLLARAPKSRIVDHAGITISRGPRPKREMPSFAIDNHAGGEMNWSESFKLVNCTLPDPYEAQARAICEAAQKE